ncbi:hypothetical protein H0H92_015490 [Tricholoma furcatifolium]|nr:hypothetical protein H0H92_015490 [Tricholoma furcatifolium]
MSSRFSDIPYIPLMKPKASMKSVSLILGCATALFSDGYNNGVIGSVNTLLVRTYGQDTLSHHNYSTVITSVGFAGFVVGMLSFGYISDKVGRKFGMLTASGLILLFSGLSSASSGAKGSVNGLLSMLSAMRFFLGIGLGAEYPCGSVAASEQSEEEVIHKNSWHRWLALATSKPIFVAADFMANLRMDEPLRYKKDSMKYAKIPYTLVIKRYWPSLAAISVIWFLYDFIAYPFALYSSIIVNK